jgi:membrane-associated tyrosine/threonine-specific cdc2-inhibitory kinase
MYLILPIFIGKRSVLTKSLGLIILEISAHVDLPQNGDLWQQLREGNLDGFDECFLNLNRTLSLQSIMKQMLKPNPLERPSCKALLSHPHIAKIKT